MIEIEGPDGAIVEFPAGTSDAVISTAMRKAYPTPAQPVMSAPGGEKQLSASGIGLSQGLTANFGDELFAGALTPIEMGIAAYKGTDAGKSLTERASTAYEKALARERGQLKRAEAESPVATMAGNIAGGLMTGGALGKGGMTLLNAAKPTALSMIGRGAAEGAIYGGISGAGAGEGAQDRFKQAAIGASVGAGAGGIMGKLAASGAAKAARQSVPASADLQAAQKAAFDASEAAGVVYTPQVFQRVSTDLKNELADLGYDAALQPRIGAVLKRIDEAAGQNVTLKGADNLRKVARGAFDPTNKTSNMMSGRAISLLDDALDNPQAADVLMGNGPQGVSALKQARELSSRLFKAGDVEQAVASAELKAASTGSGGNADNSTRQAIRRVLESRKNWTQDEREALETVIRGSKGQNALRLAGKLSPSGNGLMAALGLGATAVNPMMAIPAVGGMVAKSAADRMTKANVDVLTKILLNGGNKPSMAALPPGRRAILEALLQAQAQQGHRVSNQ